MKIKNHSDIYKVLEKKADLENEKVPISQLPSNVVHSGLPTTTPIMETPTIDADGVTLRFTNPHNLVSGQPIIVEENGGTLPIGMRDKIPSTSKFPQLIDKRLYIVYSVPSSTTIQLGAAYSSMGTSAVALNKAIVAVGGAFETTTASGYCMEKDSLGNLYVAFVDGSTSPIGKVTVKKFDGSVWTVVGSAGFTAESATYLSFAIATDNALYVAFKGSTTNKCIVMKYDGSTWVTVGAPLPTVGNASYTSIATYSTTPYIAFQDSNQSNKCVVMKYDGSAWVTVGTNPISAGSANYIKMKIATNGNIYVAFSDGTTTPSGKATVKMYDGSVWSTVGTLGFSTNSVASMSILISNDNIPYIAFADSSAMQVMVMKYASGSWSIVGSAFPSSMSINITIANDGSIYATYFNMSGMKTYMSKFTSGAWSTAVNMSGDSSAVGVLLNDEYHICGLMSSIGTYTLAKLSATDNGTGNWRVCNLATRYDIPNLNFNSDGGTYEVDIKGVLLQKTGSSLLYLAVNDLATSIYFSPYNTSSFGSTMYSLLAISANINDFTLKISIKRMSSDVIKVEISSSLLSSYVFNSITGSPINACVVGYIRGAGIENITKLSLIATGCPILNDSPIIIRRVLNNAN